MKTVANTGDFTVTLLGAAGSAEVTASVFNPPSLEPVVATVAATEVASGVWGAVLAAPTTLGEYIVVWAVNSVAVAAEELTVVNAGDPAIGDPAQGTPVGYFPLGYSALGGGPEQLPLPLSWKPSTRQIAKVVIQMSRHRSGRAVKDFNELTKTTDTDINDLLVTAIGDVELVVGPINNELPTSLWGGVSSALLYRTCQLLVMSRTPEKVGGENSLADMFQSMFDGALKRLEKASKEASSGNTPGGIDDVYLGSHTFDSVTPSTPAPGKEFRYIWFDPTFEIWRAA